MKFPDINRSRRKCISFHEANHVSICTSRRLWDVSHFEVNYPDLNHDHIPWCAEIARPNSKPLRRLRVVNDQPAGLIILLGSPKAETMLETTRRSPP
jgi:hypothetical protein